MVRGSLRAEAEFRGLEIYHLNQAHVRFASKLCIDASVVLLIFVAWIDIAALDYTV